MCTKTMKWLLIITVSSYFIPESSAFIFGEGNEVYAKYKEGDRYFHFPGDGDGKVYLVDTQEMAFRFGIIKKGKSVYYLYTRNNPKEAQILTINDTSSIKNSNYDAEKVTVFLVHGWRGNATNPMNVQLTEAFLFNNDVNVIVVDWSDVAVLSYITAIEKVPQVGSHLGNFINWLTTLGISYNKIHLVGFSLGAHIVGNAGRATGAKIQRITALDPAGPLWDRNPNRILKSDCKYVEVIHTNTLLFGFSDLCGHADFFPNGGALMPGCIEMACSHSRSYEYMAYSVKFNNMFAKECKSLDDQREDKCSGTLYPMGNSDLSKSRSGIFRVNTEIDLP